MKFRADLNRIDAQLGCDLIDDPFGDRKPLTGRPAPRYGPVGAVWSIRA